MVENKTLDLTEDEEQLYDRQIRLWGLESQKRLRTARVLVIGLDGLGAEVTKNLVLAGVKELVMLDDVNLREVDTYSQFLAPTTDIGKNRAEASLERAQQLNPLVKISAVVGSVSSQPNEFFKPFEVIVATGLSTNQLITLDNLARENGSKLFVGDVFGLFGYLLIDLQSHEFVEDVSTPNPVPVGDGAKKKFEFTVKSVKNQVEYPPLEKVLNVEQDFSAVRRPSLSPLYFLMKALLQFRSEHKRDPAPSENNNDIAIIQEITNKEMSAAKFPSDKLDSGIYSKLFSKLSPATAIVGGVLSQEVIKAVSQKDRPHRNTFFFNPEQCSGSVHEVAC